MLYTIPSTSLLVLASSPTLAMPASEFKFPWDILWAEMLRILCKDLRVDSSQTLSRKKQDMVLAMQRVEEKGCKSSMQFIAYRHFNRSFRAFSLLFFFLVSVCFSLCYISLVIDQKFSLTVSEFIKKHEAEVKHQTRSPAPHPTTISKKPKPVRSPALAT